MVALNYKQINIRMSPQQHKDLRTRWLKYKKANRSTINFNAFVNTFLQTPQVQPVNDPLQPKVPLGNCFTDQRGSITNILNRECTAIALITSKKGTVRSNHWHKSDWHYLYVISGQMQYSERSLDGTYKKEFMVEAGEMVFTAPGLVHRTIFTQDTVLLSLGNYVDHDEDTTKEQF